MAYPYAADWERRSNYLLRPFLTDPQALSPIPELGESKASLPPDDVSGGLSPLPELIIEIQRKYDGDESEEFYNKLEVKMKRVYRKWFLGQDVDVDATLSIISSGKDNYSSIGEETRDGAESGTSGANGDDQSLGEDLVQYEAVEEEVEEEGVEEEVEEEEAEKEGVEEEGIEGVQEETIEEEGLEEEDTVHLTASPRSPPQSEQADETGHLEGAQEDLAQKDCEQSDPSLGHSPSEAHAAEGGLEECSQSQTFTEEPCATATTASHSGQGDTEGTLEVEEEELSETVVEAMRAQRPASWCDSMQHRASSGSDDSQNTNVTFILDRLNPDILADSVHRVSSSPTAGKSPLLGKKRSLEDTASVEAMRSQRPASWRDSMQHRASSGGDDLQNTNVTFIIDRLNPEILADSVHRVSSSPTAGKSPLLGRKRSLEDTASVAAKSSSEDTASVAAKRCFEDISGEAAKSSSEDTASVAAKRCFKDIAGEAAKISSEDTASVAAERCFKDIAGEAANISSEYTASVAAKRCFEDTASVAAKRCFEDIAGEAAKSSSEDTASVAAKRSFDDTGSVAAKKRREEDQQAAAPKTAVVDVGRKDAATITVMECRHVCTQTEPTRTRDRGTQTDRYRHWRLVASQ